MVRGDVAVSHNVHVAAASNRNTENEKTMQEESEKWQRHQKGLFEVVRTIVVLLHVATNVVDMGHAGIPRRDIGISAPQLRRERDESEDENERETSKFECLVKECVTRFGFAVACPSMVDCEANRNTNEEDVVGAVHVAVVAAVMVVAEVVVVVVVNMAMVMTGRNIPDDPSCPVRGWDVGYLGWRCEKGAWTNYEIVMEMVVSVW